MTVQNIINQSIVDFSITTQVVSLPDFVRLRHSLEQHGHQ